MRDHRGTAVAGIGIGGFARELPDKRLPELVGHVLSEAKKITDALGGALGALASMRDGRLAYGRRGPPGVDLARMMVA